MYPGESIPVIGNFFKITFIENPGMAFGFNPGSDFKLWISLFSLVASIALFIYLYIVRNRHISLKISLAMILAGAVGNLIDRTFYGIIYGYAPVFYGKVVDFLDFDFFNFTIFGRNYDRWPIFNLADASVTIGVLILIFFYNQHKHEEKIILSEVNKKNDIIAEDEQAGEKEELKNPIKHYNDDQTDKGKEI